MADQATFSLDEDEDDPDEAADTAALSLDFWSAGLSEAVLLAEEDSLDCLSFAAAGELDPFLLSVR
jgi:hypothetical protein